VPPYRHRGSLIPGKHILSSTDGAPPCILERRATASCWRRKALSGINRKEGIFANQPHTSSSNKSMRPNHRTCLLRKPSPSKFPSVVVSLRLSVRNRACPLQQSLRKPRGDVKSGSDAVSVDSDDGLLADLQRAGLAGTQTSQMAFATGCLRARISGGTWFAAYTMVLTPSGYSSPCIFVQAFCAPTDFFAR
jgi:hypothetical protein